jgi:hypothetical protein
MYILHPQILILNNEYFKLAVFILIIMCDINYKS